MTTTTTLSPTQTEGTGRTVDFDPLLVSVRAVHPGVSRRLLQRHPRRWRTGPLVEPHPIGKRWVDRLIGEMIGLSRTRASYRDSSSGNGAVSCAGEMFWLTWKRFCGSYLALIDARRS